ncbi:MAG TPA: AraC family transcriptional regulator ligand-binding domain-containing protein [Pseudomonas sp.]|nr:AraC family transcriptional regulator ligand-binding domain-containing protein [Pseudomonas sp.]
MPRTDAAISETPSELAHGHLRVAPLMALPDLMRKLGGSLEPILNELRIPSGLLDKPENVLPIIIVGQLLALSAEQVHCEHLGLLLGSSCGMAQLGVGGRMMLLMPTVGQALDILQRALHIHDRAAVVTLRHMELDSVALGYGIFEGGFTGIQLVQDAALMIGLRIMQALCGPGWVPAEVTFSHRSPARPDIYAHLLGAPCHFDRKNTELIFPADTLARATRPCPGQSAKNSTEFDRLNNREWVERTRTATYALLLSGKCNRQEIALHLRVSMRTLNRLLEQEGATYSEIVDRARYAISSMLLKETDLSIQAVAHLMAYTDPASFNRAFRRWAGLPPARWRSMKHNQEYGCA